MPRIRAHVPVSVRRRHGCPPAGAQDLWGIRGSSEPGRAPPALCGGVGPAGSEAVILTIAPISSCHTLQRREKRSVGVPQLHLKSLLGFTEQSSRLLGTKRGLRAGGGWSVASPLSQLPPPALAAPFGSTAHSQRVPPGAGTPRCPDLQVARDCRAAQVPSTPGIMGQVCGGDSACAQDHGPHAPVETGSELAVAAFAMYFLSHNEAAN